MWGLPAGGGPTGPPSVTHGLTPAQHPEPVVHLLDSRISGDEAAGSRRAAISAVVETVR